MTRHGRTTIIHPASNACAKAVRVLSEAISQRTGLELTVTEAGEQDVDFVAEGDPPALAIEAVEAPARDDALAGCDLTEDEFDGPAAPSCLPGGGTVGRHYLRTLQSIARKRLAAEAVLARIGRPGRRPRGRPGKRHYTKRHRRKELQHD